MSRTAICEQIMELISQKKGSSIGAGSGNDTVSTYFQSMQQELDVLKKQNFLMSGSTATAKGEQDGSKKHALGDPLGDASRKPGKRPRM